MGIAATPLRSAVTVSVLGAALLLSACAPTGEDAGARAGSAAVAPGSVAESVAGTLATLADLGLNAEDSTALAEGLDALAVADRPAELMATIMPTEVRIQPDQPGEIIVPIADDQFYLSLAPYRTQTHPCTFHVPTSCLGELRGVDAQLRVTDAATGDVVVDRAARTGDNGFMGVWLPRDGEFVVEVTVAGGTGTQTVRTGAEDPTCLTTLQVS
ncbi:hypothetical protein EDF60_0421 [Leucobacter luti]|uniref:CueP family metal-binding protein n=1 Tax=Leucobacter luti TaxID=340320 RepID=UPI00104A6FAC|nr:CueP family metal-binding protein [Leucobacter luti]MCW2288648.1 hypothetical protein [Leucobacter luti]TCK45196.1 hypothetical protein EDF60_0421 [Leucobacter luti]